MELFRRIFFAAVLAGAVAGLALALVQQWRVVPLIHQAELYESGHVHGEELEAHTHEDGTSHIHEADQSLNPWEPADGFERTAYTILATTLTGMGFVLVIGAISVLTDIEITAANGVVWGLGGFLAFSLAPAFGLPPGVPGMEVADLAERQIWWWATALFTGAAMLTIAKFRTLTAIFIGIVLAAVPHLYGAPQVIDPQSEIPAHIATAFTATALAASMIFWLLAGTLIGWLNQRFEGRAA